MDLARSRHEHRHARDGAGEHGREPCPAARPTQRHADGHGCAGQGDEAPVARSQGRRKRRQALRLEGAGQEHRGDDEGDAEVEAAHDGKGTSFTARARRKRPKAIWIRPQTIVIAQITTRPAPTSGSPPWRIASDAARPVVKAASRMQEETPRARQLGFQAARGAAHQAGKTMAPTGAGRAQHHGVGTERCKDENAERHGRGRDPSAPTIPPHTSRVADALMQPHGLPAAGAFRQRVASPFRSGPLIDGAAARVPRGVRTGRGR